VLAAADDRGYRNPNARKSLHCGTQVCDLCAQRTFCPLTRFSGLQTRWRTGLRPVFRRTYSLEKS
jgi:hypothetical protein